MAVLLRLMPFPLYPNLSEFPTLYSLPTYRKLSYIYGKKEMLSNRLFRGYSPGQCYRSVSEIVLWLPLQEIVLTLERLSKSWQRLISSKELWETLILRDIENVDLKDANAFSSLRVAYKALYIRKSYLYFWKNKENSMALYSPADDSLKAIHFTNLKNLDCTSSFLYLKDGRLLSCGGRGGMVMGVAMYSRSVYIVDLYSRSLERKRDMRERKSDLELVELNGFVYCFGGHNIRKLTTVEQCSTQELAWEKHSEMPSAQDVISGVAHWNKIFLACQPANRLQVYDPSQQTFTTLALLPTSFIKGLSILQASQWILFQDAKNVLVIKLADAAIHSARLNNEHELDVNQAFGIRLKSKVYFVSHDQDKEVAGVYALDLLNFRITASHLFNSY